MDPVMEIELKKWIDNYLQEHQRMPSTFAIRNRAYELTSFKETFKASKGWCEKFIKRNFIQSKTEVDRGNTKQIHAESPQEIFFDRTSSERQKYTRGFLDQHSPIQEFIELPSPQISEWKLTDYFTDEH